MPFLQQMSSFAIVGAIGTAVHYLVFIALVELAGSAPVPATSAGAVLGALVNYALNYRITFASRADHARTLARFMVVAAVALILNAVIVDAAIRFVHVHYLFGQLLATGVVFVFGYAANRAWTFSEADRAGR